jgi:hypothetical protein
VPIILVHLVGLSLGAAFAWAAGPELARSEKPAALTPAFAVVAAFVAFIWIPVGGYFALFHSDWSYLYLVAQHPSAIDLALVMLSGACVGGGFLATAKAARKRRLGSLLAAAGVPATIALAGLPVVLRRLSVSATYSQFHGDFGTQPIGSSLLGRAVLVLGALVALGAIWTVRALTRLTSAP